ncbi:MAG TPA: adenosylcobinamide-GDP ribazoletransferase [Paludibacter sp.]|nr:adenosylcobinamide-GDP ribazoletransferase [Paludibacter sp.]
MKPLLNQASTPKNENQESISKSSASGRRFRGLHFRMKAIGYQLAAAITFFTRLPVWKIVTIPAEAFSNIICFWPMTGIITGSLTALAWLGSSYFFSPIIAIILAFAARVLFTGGFHEDGLADFLDGFGGGRTKADVLRIMKDSHLGSYALIGFVLYYSLLFNSLNSIPKEVIATIIFVSDPFSKFLAILPMNLLPYARTENESKSKTLYKNLTFPRWIIAVIFGFSPIVILLDVKLLPALLLPITILIITYLLLRKKIGGYTGDTCGAIALLCELGFFMAVSGMYHFINLK